MKHSVELFLNAFRTSTFGKSAFAATANRCIIYAVRSHLMLHKRAGFQSIRRGFSIFINKVFVSSLSLRPQRHREAAVRVRIRCVDIVSRQRLTSFYVASVTGVCVPVQKYI